MATKRVAIVQSSYIPWKGYFDLIRSVDEFILYDDAQYTTRDWRNRNRIKTDKGLEWLTIPVSARRGEYVKDVTVRDERWARRHWEAIRRAYGKASFFKLYGPVLEKLYSGKMPERLSQINRLFIEEINRLLGILTPVRSSMDYGVDLKAGKTDKLVGLCARAGGTQYLSGPSAKSYIDERVFQKAGIQVQFADYSGYPEYVQFFGQFSHQVSILDLLFHTGPNALSYMRRL